MKALNALPPTLLAALGVLSGCTLDVTIKTVALSVSVITIATWRYMFASVYAYGIFRATNSKWPSKKRMRFHTFRGAVQVIASLTFFYALTQLALAEATVLGLTAALMVAPVARVILGEKITAKAILATLIGFLGAVVAVSATTQGAPEGTNRIAGVIAVFVSALTYSTSIVLLRLSTREDSAPVVIFMTNLIPAIILFPTLFFLPMVTNLWLYPVFAFLGLCGLGIWGMFTLAYARAPAQRLAPIEYTSLIWAGLYGFVFFGEIPGWQLYVGAAIIIGACLIIVLEEARLARLQMEVLASEMID